MSGGRGSFEAEAFAEAAFPAAFFVRAVPSCIRRRMDFRFLAVSLTWAVSSATSSLHEDPALDSERDRDLDLDLSLEGIIIIQQRDATITHCITNMAMNQSSSMNGEK